MSNYFDLRNAVREGAPAQLFELGQFLAERLFQRNLSTDQLQALSGNDLAKEILNRAEETGK